MKTILFSLLLCSCAQTQYVTVYKIPVAPPELLIPCEQPVWLTENNVANLIEMTLTNMPRFATCNTREAGWIEWYNKMKDNK
jgi:hypothetical protein